MQLFSANHETRIAHFTYATTCKQSNRWSIELNEVTCTAEWRRFSLMSEEYYPKIIGSKYLLDLQLHPHIFNKNASTSLCLSVINMAIKTIRLNVETLTLLTYLKSTLMYISAVWKNSFKL